jgi:hypothetical protein
LCVNNKFQNSFISRKDIIRKLWKWWGISGTCFYVCHAERLMKDSLEAETSVKNKEVVDPRRDLGWSKWFRWLASPTWMKIVTINVSHILINSCCYSLQLLINCNLVYSVIAVQWTRHLEGFTGGRLILKFHNGNSVPPNHVLCPCFITAASNCIPVYLLHSIRLCVSQLQLHDCSGIYNFLWT